MNPPRWLGALVLVCVQGFAADPPLLDTLSAELNRNFTALQEKGQVKPYFIQYSVVDDESWQVSAAFGASQRSGHGHRRTGDVSVRVGDRQLDNYHRLQGVPLRFGSGTILPLGNLPGPLVRTLWMETSETYEAAVERLIRIKTNKQVKAEEQDRSPDFSEEKPSVADKPVPALRFNEGDWTTKTKRWSSIFEEFPRVMISGVSVTARREEKFLVNTEGTRLHHGRRFVRITINASGRAEDGMDLETGETFEAETPEDLPKDEVVMAASRRVATDLTRLFAAPPAEPFVGPAILSGRAAGVFFHEIFGHRMEGHRQKDEAEGQTFTKKVGEPILPPFLSVLFDPTRHTLGGEDLNGWYDYDDEGVVAQRVAAVENGVLKTFLMSRSPIDGFLHSNGHGRRQPGREVVSRQSNLIVESTKAVPDGKLREMLIEEVKRQGKPYGLYFEEVTGGFTFTGRSDLQAFRVMPRIVYRVYADGRPDELIRGANIVGTPLAAFAKILATSDKPGIFNGYCGAESGSVPVSAVSPALLVSEIEIEKQQTSQQRPPFLPPPSQEPTN